MTVKDVFYFEKINRWDFYSILVYVLITFILFVNPFDFINKEILLGYSFLTPLFLYQFNYKSLRKLNVWFVWLAISLLHLVLHSFFSEIDKYLFPRGPASHFLNYTWLFLLVFQFLRIVSLASQKIELVAPNKDVLDIWDKRKVAYIDGICYALFWIIMFIVAGS